ncbi:CBS domain-containing protein [Embleya sp. NBC_00896]|uniref:CBS domain-containing protein n=1 Tax=Embleya sp. NBC_00896 TaxID=2975961 RepID=UPI0038707F72|nr:CBS domain-containing protein [Embleya sp. NBC_00896]
MRARDLAEQYESVTLRTEALTAARLLAEHRLPGLLVLGGTGRPVAILPASQVVRTLVPTYVQDDPALARVIDERHADRLCQALAGRTVADILPDPAAKPPLVDPDDTALEVAAVMAAERSPLVAVVDPYTHDRDGRLLGVITASRLLEQLLAAQP